MSPDEYPIFRESQRLKEQQGTTEEILALYRRSGLSILESMQLFRRLMNVPLSEAKQVVHSSKTWSDVRAQHESFQAAAEDAAKCVGEEND